MVRLSRRRSDRERIGLRKGPQRSTTEAEINSGKITGMSSHAALSSSIASINPATGDILGRFETTPIAGIPGILARARRAQAEWAREPLRARCGLLRLLREKIYARRQELAETITRESGKPRVESFFSHFFVSLHAADYYSTQAPQLLNPERRPHPNTAVKAKPAW